MNPMDARTVDDLKQVSQEYGICMGNLTMEQMESRMEVIFTDEMKEYFRNNRQEDCSRDLEPEAWHCFDIPFEMHVGSMERARWIFEKLSALHPNVQNFNIRFPM